MGKSLLKLIMGIKGRKAFPVVPLFKMFLFQLNPPLCCCASNNALQKSLKLIAFTKLFYNLFYDRIVQKAL